MAIRKLTDDYALEAPDNLSSIRTFKSSRHVILLVGNLMIK